MFNDSVGCRVHVDAGTSTRFSCCFFMSVLGCLTIKASQIHGVSCYTAARHRPLHPATRHLEVQLLYTPSIMHLGFGQNLSDTVDFGQQKFSPESLDRIQKNTRLSWQQWKVRFRVTRYILFHLAATDI